MRHRFVTAGSGIAAAAALAFSFCTAAHADDTTKVAKPLSIKIGGLFTTDGDTKDLYGSSHFTAGVSYDFLKTKATSPIILSAYGDYFFESSKTLASNDEEGFDLHGKNSNWGIGVSARTLLGKAGGPIMPYVGLGIGVYQSSFKFTSDGDSVSDHNTGVGGKIFVGVESNSGIFGEVNYTLLPKGSDDTLNGDAKASGPGVSIGYRF